MSIQFERNKKSIFEQQQVLLKQINTAIPSSNGIVQRYRNPVVTKDHIPLDWRFDFNPSDNPFFMERISFNSTMNAGALYWQGKFLLFVRVEGVDRKSFFAVAESPNGIDSFNFWERPLSFPDIDPNETNTYDMRITAHEDGWVYGIFCSERLAPDALAGDLSTAIASSGIIRSKDLLKWERLPDIKSTSQQRNVVLHPEFVNGKYALYTRPQDDFIFANKGGGIGWTLLDDICNPVVVAEEIVNPRRYHTIKEVKNGEGPAPIKTEKGWLHLAHGVRGTAAGLRYVLYLYVTSLDQPNVMIAEPAGYFMAPEGKERVGDVSNVLFSNGWIVKDDVVYIYYASSDTRVHVASSTVEQLLDYCFETAVDGLRSAASVKKINALIEKNKHYIEATNSETD
ncbi:glycoside hydrolase family 130 protein [Sphingobacterium yanglingense]|uniref:4-O-beta-D-mannosyl-D-glucose phosphorylase n=1 Tax=Sphingobacterium yanglingense TaxID=1437280 RepID=A0A4R6WDT9_9SPHI|nr:glycosidase [Sphingobacterium yanglingense]TDQ76312.1 4-O-beta-D-mannosyl-D-glucose phosphorylase [Sphingobacterium yanglingense]